MTDKQDLRAFAVLEENENTGGIVFAKTNAQARRLGAGIFADGDFHSVSCRRAPFADHCAEDQIVSNALLIDNGWHFECAWTGERIDIDSLDERDLVPEDVTGTQHGLAFMNAVNEAEFRLDRAQHEHVKRRWIRRLKRVALRLYPDAKVKGGGYAYTDRLEGVIRVVNVRIEFDWSEKQIAPASLEINAKSKAGRRRPFLMCATGDKALFEAWVAGQKQGRVK